MVLNKFFWIFRFTRKDKDKVTAFIDAYEWIDTYKKAGEYDTAIMAARELLLKVKSGITYYSDAQKKVITLANSNISEVAKAAKDKSKIIDHELKSLYMWEEKLRKIVVMCEELKAKEAQRLVQARIQGEIQQEITLIRSHIKKNEISQAYHLSKKLLASHHDSKEAVDMLNKTQKLYNKAKLKEDQRLDEEKKRGRFLQEAGISTKVIDASSANEEDAPKEKWTGKLQWVFSGILQKHRERREYIKRQRSLRAIEQLLIRSGTITKVKEGEKSEEIMHIMESGLTKDIGNFKIDGYEFFGKIIGKDKIVGDTFGKHKIGTKTIFYFGDATGHGVQAGLTVSILTKIFFEQVKKMNSTIDLFFEVNNRLKESLKARLFVTAVFFEHDSLGGKLKYIGAGHDPLIFFQAKTGQASKFATWGIATGTRKITNLSSIKLKDFPMEDHDIFVGYTDGIVEAKSSQNEFYGIERLRLCIEKSVPRSQGSLIRLYDLIMQDVEEFIGGKMFLDDVSIFIFKRNSGLDIITDKSELDKLLSTLDSTQRTLKVDLNGKTRQEIQEEIRKQKHAQELRVRLINMEKLYKIGEYARLKQEIAYCYKNGFIDSKMDFYLKKIIKNEDKVKSLKLEDRLVRKYETLNELYDKGEYAIVIRETIDVIYKNGNI